MVILLNRKHTFFIQEIPWENEPDRRIQATKKHARAAHETCDEVPLDIHTLQLRHAKASHWLEDGMNIVKALATLEDEDDKKVSKSGKM